MKRDAISSPYKGLSILAMANAGIWAISLIALIVLLQGHGHLKGMFVILAGGTVVAIQLMTGISKLKQ